MLFNSYTYIFLFLPLVVAGYFLLCRGKKEHGTLWLIGASLVFYGWWNPVYLPLICASILFNAATGRILTNKHERGEAVSALIGIAVGANLLLLGIFKYADFATTNVNSLLGTNFTPPHIALPLAISFFTFQQIRYVVECAKGTVREKSFLRYCLFVTFFPQLIAGPIVDHREMMPQFAAPENARPRLHNIVTGAHIFALGLFKKVAVADMFAKWATYGFDTANALGFMEAWAAAFSYTFQIYFDFSGYTDMAIGSALMLNIRLPMNFDSPYRALSVRDFWRRWHMTLSRFLREYLYFPLGGSRRGEAIAIRNVLITFLLGGLWHGAGWTFVVWGSLHGLGCAVNRLWAKTGLRLPVPVAWSLTFLFITISWVFFRAETFDDAEHILSAMFTGPWTGMDFATCRTETGLECIWGAIAMALAACLGLKNSGAELEEYRPSSKKLAAFAVMWILAFINLSGYSEFIYFRF